MVERVPWAAPHGKRGDNAPLTEPLPQGGRGVERRKGPRLIAARLIPAPVVPRVPRYLSGFIILAREVTGTSVNTSENRISRFLKLIRAIMLFLQVPVTLATEE